MTSESLELPPGWTWASLGELADMQGGIQKQPKRAPKRNAYPFLRVANVLRGRLDLSEVHEIELFGDELHRLRLETGDLLIVEGNGSPSEIGRMAVWSGAVSNCVHQNHIIRARPLTGVCPQFLEAYWNSPNGARAVREIASSTTGLYTLSVSKVAGLKTPLAPLEEQRRIVAAIEEQFTRLDAAVESLLRARANLRHYRAAVIAAAVDGRLNASHEVESSEWPYITLGELTARSEYGTSVKCAYDATGHPVLRIPNIVRGRIDLADMKYATMPFPLDDESALNPGDMLICRTNGSIQLIGKTAIVCEPLTPPHAFASYLLRFRFQTSQVQPAWVHLYLSSEAGRRFIEANAASSAGQHNISLSLLYRMPVPLPPLSQQEHLVAEVEARLSAVEEMEASVEANLKRAKRVRQAILKRAFEGKLVPQDPADEPARALVDRIGTERAASSAATPLPRRSSSRVQRANAALQEPLPLQ